MAFYKHGLFPHWQGKKELIQLMLRFTAGNTDVQAANSAYRYSKDFYGKNMKVSEIGNAILDRWVAQAEGIEVRYSNAGEFWRIMGEIDELQWLPHRDWAQAGPIIEREQIAIVPNGHDWHAFLALDHEHEQAGPTPLIAAMRCYVAHKFGTELPDKP